MKKTIIALFMAITAMTCCISPAAAAELTACDETEITSMTERPCQETIENDKAIIDYTNASNGYVSVRYVEETDKRLKFRVTCGDDVYTYDLQQGEWDDFPLSSGSGEYGLTVYENVQDNRYRVTLKGSVSVELLDEPSVYLHSNKYVNYENAPMATALAAELTEGLKTDGEKIDAIYEYVWKNVSYDYGFANEIKAGMHKDYIPDIDETLASGDDICFGYASLMAGMLRSQGVPCRLVIGYVPSGFHAWVEAYRDGIWTRMDPTFMSTNGNARYIDWYVSQDAKYDARYYY